MSSISNDKKTALCIAGLVLLVIGAVLALTVGQDYQDRKTAITNLYDQCMNDDLVDTFMDGDKQEYCQCKADLLYEIKIGDIGLKDTVLAFTYMQDVLPISNNERANIGSTMYCAVKAYKEEK